MTDHNFMQAALEQARLAETKGEVPVGAVVVFEEGIVATGHNQPITDHDPTAHAEIIAMRNAAKYLKNYRLVGATLYVTLEPCAMCAAAMIHARIERLVYAASDPKAGAVESVLQLLDESQFNHRVAYRGGVLRDVSSQLLKDFFRQRR